MEIVIIVAAAVGLIGWWIWKEGRYEETGHPLEGATKPIEPYPFPASRPEKSKTVHAVDVGSAGPAEAVAIVEQAQAKVKKAKKPAAPKKEKKPAAPKKPAKITAAKPKAPKKSKAK